MIVCTNSVELSQSGDLKGSSRIVYVLFAWVGKGFEKIWIYIIGVCLRYLSMIESVDFRLKRDVVWAGFVRFNIYKKIVYALI